jgi:hypothetical protein
MPRPCDFCKMPQSECICEDEDDTPVPLRIPFSSPPGPDDAA